MAARIDVLAVDDSPSNLLSLEAILSDLGADLVKAQSGDEALLRILERDPALILLDIQMPGLDGFETARLIRMRDRCRHVPIIFVTAFQHDASQVEKGYSLGAVDFLFKPIVPAILRSKVSTFLELHRKNAEVLRQSQLLQEAAKRDHERALAEARNVALRRSNERLQLLADNANRLLLEEHPVGAFQPLFAEISGHLGLEAYVVHTLEPDGRTLQLRAHGGLDAEAAGELARLQLGSVGPVLVPDVQSSAEPAAELLRRMGLHGGLLLPLVAHGRLLGTVALGTRKAAAIGAEEMSVVQLVATQCAMAVDRASLIEELRLRASELRDADRRKDEFLAMLAHELRNPLAPLVNALQLFRRRVVGDPQIERTTAAAERQAGHMARLVDDLLDVSRITQGKIELRTARVDLRPVIEHALETSAPVIADRQHRLEVQLPEGEVKVEADATRLAQVVGNLLNNAAKYTDPGGRIALAVSVEGRELQVEVRDDGLGIRPDMLDKIFDTFVQVDPTSDRARGGLGLGLTLVRSLVELHGGTVRAHSDGPGKGSTFEVRMPVVAEVVPPRLQLAPVPAGATATAPQMQLAKQGQRILLVEDNEDIRLTLRDLLEWEGHQVEEAPDGPKGVQAIVASRPNVALVDLGLPGLDGYQVAQQVRAAPGTEQTRLIALTGYGGEEVSRKARAAGFDAHLTKPVNLDDLFRVIQKLA